MVRYGTVWYGMVWYGTVRYGMVWYGMVQDGTVWYRMVYYSISLMNLTCRVWTNIDSGKTS